MPLLYMFPLFGKFVNSVTELVFGSDTHPDIGPFTEDSEEEIFADAHDLADCCGHQEDNTSAVIESPIERRNLFAVALPLAQHVEGGKFDSASLKLFDQFDDVIAFCKSNKAASPRWKQVADTREAQDFSFHLSEALNRSDLNENTVPVRTNKESVAWRMPPSQETVQLRKCIETGSVVDVRSIIYSNPRFLIGSGDTPTVLQEGCRYNACHIACKANRADMLAVIINTLRSKDFFKKMYPEDTDETTESRMAFLLDLYLNMPDKTRRSETPLHFACKFGAIDCVRLLLEQPECDRSVVNGDGAKASEIICERATGQPVLARRIKALFEERFVIPIIRDEVGDSIPRIGPPVPPSQLDSIVLSSPLKSSKKIVSAVIGPLTASVASEVMAELARLRKTELQIRLSDAEKGLEKVARQVARRHGVGWTERWEFLDRSLDLSSAEGLEAFEDYLQRQYDEVAEVKFVMGSYPTKTDSHVWHALEQIIEGIDTSQLPFIGAWINRMKAFTVEEMTSWRTPVKTRLVRNERGAGDTVSCLTNLMERFTTDDR